MRRYTHAVRRSVATILATLAPTASLLLAEAAGAAVTPPPNTPDLAGMALQLGDLPQGASVDSEGYQKPLDGSVAVYDRTLVLPESADIVVVDDTVELYPSAAMASSEFRAEQRLLRSRSARRSLGRAVARGMGMGKARVHVGVPRRVDAGDGAFTIALRIPSRGGAVQLVYGTVRVDRALSLVSVVGTGARTTLRRARGYVHVAADHVRTGLSPVAMTPPGITGAPVVGSTLQAGTGTWAEATKPAGFSYEWRRCDVAGAACVAIPGATGSMYVLTPADAGATLRVAVTAANAAGTTEVVSTPSSLVA